MDYHWLKRRSIARFGLHCVLAAFLSCLALAGASKVALSQEKSTPPLASPLNAGASSAPGTKVPPRAPDAVSYPFLRLVGVLLSGFAINAASLARKFRRFLGLGVFNNLYSALFLLFGIGVCGFPVTYQSALRTVPHLQFWGPWIADFSGIVVALILPSIRFKAEERPSAEVQVRGLEAISSSNPILAVIEDAIRDRILQRMQVEIVAASKRYDWEAIKLAARNALEMEMTMRPLVRDEYESVRDAIAHFEPVADARLNSQKKYEALIQLLRWCSFKQLERELDAAEKECLA